MFCCLDVIDVSLDIVPIFSSFEILETLGPIFDFWGIFLSGLFFKGFSSLTVHKEGCGGPAENWRGDREQG